MADKRNCNPDRTLLFKDFRKSVFEPKGPVMNQRKILGVGIVGAGFIGHFHAKSFTGVRDADIVAVSSRRRESADELAQAVRDLGVGDAVAYDSVQEMVRDPRVDAVWVLVPNHVRLEVVKAIVDEVNNGAELVGIAIEKPLGRNLSESRQILEMVENSGLLHAYLENQVYAPAVTRSRDLIWERGAKLAGSPYLARCTEEHSGPHSDWFWDGESQGGGVLSDMMCHSIEAARFLLTPPDKDPAEWLTPVSVEATIASLKWGRKEYAAQLKKDYPDAPDYTKQPSEDYARATYTFVNGDGEPVVAETGTSWSFVGAGLRLSFELLGPEYAMEIDTLQPEASAFLSRALEQREAEDLVEKQKAEQGLMPVVPDEPAAYGYTAENAKVTSDFLARRQPRESLVQGLEVTELLMAAYKEVATGQRVTRPVDLSTFRPAVTMATWNTHA